jgi:MarR family transcriptional regulator for hemolysin
LLHDIPDEAIEIMVELLDLIGHRIAERRSQS